MKSNMNVQTTQKGFTLIELVVVIVILGILAVTAAPKFVDLTGDAKASVIRGVEGALNSATDMAHAKALLSGQSSGEISVANGTIGLVNAYPKADSIDTLMDIITTSEESDAIFKLTVENNTATYSHKDATTDRVCEVVYTEAAAPNTKPAIKSNIEKC